MLADDVVAKAGQVAGKVVEIIVQIMARQGPDALLWALKKAANMSASMIMTYMRSNMLDLSTLHQQAGGDLRMFSIAPELERSVKADLRRRGVGYSIEHGADGKTYLHFSGKDIRTIQHGLRQAAARYERKLEKRNNRTIKKSLKREARAQKRFERVADKAQRRAIKKEFNAEMAQRKADKALDNANKAMNEARQVTSEAKDAKMPPYKAWLRSHKARFKAKILKKWAKWKVLRAHKLASQAKFAPYKAEWTVERARERFRRRSEKARRQRDKKFKDNFYSQPVPYEPVPYEDQPDRKDDQKPDRDKKRDEDKSDRDKDQKPDLDNDQQPDRDQDQKPDRSGGQSGKGQSDVWQPGKWDLDKWQPGQQQPGKWQPGDKMPKFSKKDIDEIIKQRTKELVDKTKKEVDRNYAPAHSKRAR